MSDSFFPFYIFTIAKRTYRKWEMLFLYTLTLSLSLFLTPHLFYGWLNHDFSLSCVNVANLLLCCDNNSSLPYTHIGYWAWCIIFFKSFARNVFSFNYTAINFLLSLSLSLFLYHSFYLSVSVCMWFCRGKNERYVMGVLYRLLRTGIDIHIIQANIK